MSDSSEGREEPRLLEKLCALQSAQQFPATGQETASARLPQALPHVGTSAGGGQKKGEENQDETNNQGLSIHTLPR